MLILAIITMNQLNVLLSRDLTGRIDQRNFEVANQYFEIQFIHTIFIYRLDPQGTSETDNNEHEQTRF